MKLSEVAHAQVKELNILALHYQTMFESIKKAIEHTIAEDVQVDLKGGEWSLDLESGEITDARADQ